MRGTIRGTLNGGLTKYQKSTILQTERALPTCVASPLRRFNLYLYTKYNDHTVWDLGWSFTFYRQNNVWLWAYSERHPVKSATLM